MLIYGFRICDLLGKKMITVQRSYYPYLLFNYTPTPDFLNITKFTQTYFQTNKFTPIKFSNSFKYRPFNTSLNAQPSCYSIANLYYSNSLNFLPYYPNFPHITPKVKLKIIKTRKFYPATSKFYTSAARNARDIQKVCPTPSKLPSTLYVYFCL